MSIGSGVFLFLLHTLCVHGALLSYPEIADCSSGSVQISVENAPFVYPDGSGASFDSRLLFQNELKSIIVTTYTNTKFLHKGKKKK